MLVHSPLVGPYTWTLVAEELELRQIRALRPALTSRPISNAPYWKQHTRIVAQAIKSLPPDEAVILVAHSGAGALLPAIGQVSKRPVAAYIFVTSGIPQQGKSRLDLFFDVEAVEQFRHSAIDGLLPTWSNTDLAEVIPDDQTRAHFVADLKPLPLEVYEEPIPVFDDWPDAPCAFIAFISTDEYVYAASVRHAEQQGWPCVKIEGMHFHMLVDPAVVADALISAAGQIGMVIA